MSDAILIDHETPTEQLHMAMMAIMSELIARRGEGYLVALLFGTAVKFIMDRENEENGG